MPRRFLANYAKRLESLDVPQQAKRIMEFRALIASTLQKYLDSSKQIGGEVAAQAQLVEVAFHAELNYLIYVALNKSPQTERKSSLIKRLLQSIEQVNECSEDNWDSLQYNQVAAVSVGINALRWFMEHTTPVRFVNHQRELGQVYIDHLLRKFKNRDSMQEEWIRSWQDLLTSLTDFVKDCYLKGMHWCKVHDSAKKPRTVLPSDATLENRTSINQELPSTSKVASPASKLNTAMMGISLGSDDAKRLDNTADDSDASENEKWSREINFSSGGNSKIDMSANSATITNAIIGRQPKQLGFAGQIFVEDKLRENKFLARFNAESEKARHEALANARLARRDRPREPTRPVPSTSAAAAAAAAARARGGASRLTKNDISIIDTATDPTKLPSSEVPRTTFISQNAARPYAGHRRLNDALKSLISENNARVSGGDYPAISNSTSNSRVSNDRRRNQQRSRAASTGSNQIRRVSLGEAVEKQSNEQSSRVNTRVELLRTAMRKTLETSSVANSPRLDLDRFAAERFSVQQPNQNASAVLSATATSSNRTQPQLSRKDRIVPEYGFADAAANHTLVASAQAARQKRTNAPTVSSTRGARRRQSLTSTARTFNSANNSIGIVSQSPRGLRATRSAAATFRQATQTQRPPSIIGTSLVPHAQPAQSQQASTLITSSPFTEQQTLQSRRDMFSTSVVGTRLERATQQRRNASRVYSIRSTLGQAAQLRQNIATLGSSANSSTNQANGRPTQRYNTTGDSKDAAGSRQRNN